MSDKQDSVRRYGTRRVDLHFWDDQCEGRHWSGGAKFEPIPCEKVVLASEHDAAISALASRLAEAERDAARYRWIEKQRGNLFTPGRTFRATGWAWFGDDGQRYAAATLDELVDAAILRALASEDGAAVGWFLPAARINNLQQDSVREQIRLAKAAHYTNLRIRINGEWRELEADWIKHLTEQA